MSLSRILLLATFIGLFSWRVDAHHSAAVHFYLDKTVEIEGVVKEWRFTNPHVRLLVEVAQPDGNVEVWVAEGAGRNGYLRSKTYTKDSFKPGDVVIITGNPPRKPSAKMIAFTQTEIKGKPDTKSKGEERNY